MKSITHSGDKQQQLRRDANVTSLWERHSSCVRGPVHALAPSLCPGVSAVPPHTPGSHPPTESAFSPSQTHKRKRLNMCVSVSEQLLTGRCWTGPKCQRGWRKGYRGVKKVLTKALNLIPGVQGATGGGRGGGIWPRPDGGQ